MKKYKQFSKLVFMCFVSLGTVLLLGLMEVYITVDSKSFIGPGPRGYFDLLCNALALFLAMAGFQGYASEHEFTRKYSLGDTLRIVLSFFSTLFALLFGICIRTTFLVTSISHNEERLNLFSAISFLCLFYSTACMVRLWGYRKVPDKTIVVSSKTKKILFPGDTYNILPFVKPEWEIIHSAFSVSVIGDPVIETKDHMQIKNIQAEFLLNIPALQKSAVQAFPIQPNELFKKIVVDCKKTITNLAENHTLAELHSQFESLGKGASLEYLFPFGGWFSMEKPITITV